MSVWTAIGGALAAIGAALAGRQVLASSRPLWPVRGPHHVTSPFGPRTHPVTGRQDFHEGADLRAARGTPIVAVLDGEVVRVWRDHPVNGNALRIQHRGGRWRTSYVHLEALVVEVGDRVRRGQVIGYAGSTGRATGPHLHFGLWDMGAGRWVDPIPWLGGAREALA